MNQSDLSSYHELCAYTLSLRDEEFIHQHVVDAYAAQHADETTKPIGITFALVGLYLSVEKGFSGRAVQRAHMQLAREKRPWPAVTLPRDRGSITVVEVLAAPPGPRRAKAIQEWCASVWRAYSANRDSIAGLLRTLHIQ